MVDFNLQELLRPHLKNFKAYSSARTEYTGEDAIFLDANENPIGSASDDIVNRYPDPIQKKLKAEISKIKGVSPAQIFIGNGSDEVIDLLYRAFCEPMIDNVLICPPTYGMYETSAQLNNVPLKSVVLTPDFQLQVDEILESVDAHTKMIFICSPNNPTGNLIHEQDIIRILEAFRGWVVIDEAYIDFTDSESWIARLGQYPNLVVMQTLSKAWGMAGIRVGMAFASLELVQILTSIKPPYNVSILAQKSAVQAIQNEKAKIEMVRQIMEQSDRLKRELKKFKYVRKIFPSQANFILVEVEQPDELYKFLTQHHVVIRNRNTTPLCAGCVRITVGLEAENDELLKWMEVFEKANNN